MKAHLLTSSGPCRSRESITASTFCDMRATFRASAIVDRADGRNCAEHFSVQSSERMIRCLICYPEIKLTRILGNNSYVPHGVACSCEHLKQSSSERNIIFVRHSITCI